MLLSDESEFIDDKSDKFGSLSGSYSTYYFRDFYLRAEESVAGVFVSEVSTSTGFESKGGRNDFAPIGVESKGGRLNSIFLRSR